MKLVNETEEKASLNVEGVEEWARSSIEKA